MKKWIMAHGRAFLIIAWIAIAVQWITIFLRLWAFEKGTDGYAAMSVIWGIAIVVWFFAIILSLLDDIFTTNDIKANSDKTVKITIQDSYSKTQTDLLFALDLAIMKNQELRLGQLISDAAKAGGWKDSDIFYCPDEVLLKGLKENTFAES